MESYDGLLKAFEALNKRKRENPEALSENELARWRLMRCQIEEALFQVQRDPAQDTRDHLRVPISLKVRYWVGPRLTQRYLTVLGEGGLFIASQDHLPRGSHLELEIIPIQNKPKIKVRGLVTWTCEMGDPEERGMGVHFIALSEPVRQAIYSLIDETMRRRLLERRRFSRVDTDLGVLLPGANRLARHRAEDLGMGGMLLSWVDGRPREERLSFVLNLPETGTPVQGTAEIIRMAPRPWWKRSGGLGVRFVDLKEKGLDDIIQFLSRQASGQIPIRGGERRVHARIKRRLRLRFLASNSFGTTDARDISRGGVFLQTRRPPPWGSLIEISLIQPGTGETLTLPGRVVRVVHTDPRKTGIVPGVGVAFEDLSEMRISLLQTFLREYALVEQED
jgi:type IV pilus assembly protein PilZ